MSEKHVPTRIQGIYTSFISRKIEQELKEAEVELRNAEKEPRLLQSRGKSRARDIKVAEKKLNHKKNCLDNPVTVEIADELSTEVFPNIALLLEIILVCPSSGAVVERGFSVTNLAMNKLQSSMKVTTLGAIMRIYYENDLDDNKASDILEVWKKRGDRRVELP